VLLAFYFSFFLSCFEICTMGCKIFLPNNF